MRFPRLLAAVVSGSLTLAVLLVQTVAAAPGAAEDDAKIVEALPRVRHTLLDGLSSVTTGDAAPISAKFEDEGQGLSLSVYVARRGLRADADRNLLQEVAGDPTAAEWAPATATFGDVEHVARASEQLTLMRLAKVSLADVVRAVERDTQGTVYGIVPVLVDGTPVFSVRVAIEDHADAVTVDLATGRILAAPRAGWPIPRLAAPSFLGKTLPEIVVGKGQWLGEAPPVISAAAPGHVVLIAINSFLCEGTDEAWMWERLVPLYQELGGKGLAIQFVLTEAASVDEARSLVAKRGIRYPVLHDPTGENPRRWGVGRAAAVFLVGSEGRVVWQGAWAPGKAADACEKAIRTAIDILPPGPR